MSFDEFVEGKDAERATRDASRVTWRKVSEMTGGGWSGIGPGGALVFVRRPRVARWDGARYEYGTVEGKVRVLHGGTRTLAAAKTAAARLITENRDSVSPSDNE